jgi:hypothetical protein
MPRKKRTAEQLVARYAQRRKDRAAKKAAGIATQKRAVTEEQKDANNDKQREKRAAKKAAGIATQKRVGQKKRTAEQKDAQNAKKRKDRADAQNAKKRRKLDEDDAQWRPPLFSKTTRTPPRLRVLRPMLSGMTRSRRGSDRRPSLRTTSRLSW